MNEKFYYNENKTIVLTVDTSGNEAKLKLSDRCMFFNEKEIQQLIAEAGIKYGFENAKNLMAIQQVKKQLGQSFTIAKSDPARKPETEFDFIIPEELVLHPLELHQKDLNTILSKQVVEEGQRIATLRVISKGSKGKNIFGNDILPPETEEEIASELCGEGAVFKDGAFTAQKSGIPCVDRQKNLSICSMLKFEKDLQLEPETFYSFPCSVYVEGNISGKGTAYIQGDLALSGSVNGCRLFINGKTLVNQDINEAVLLSKGTVGLRQAISSRIGSNNDIKLSGQAVSSLFAANSSIVSEEDSLCSNCSVYASKNISLGSLLKSNGHDVAAGICYLPFNRESIAFWRAVLASYDSLVFVPSQDNRNWVINRDTVEEIITAYEEALLESIANDSYSDADEYRVEFMKKVSAGTKVHIYSYTTLIEEDKESEIIRASL